MTLEFIGADREVTGSCHCVTCDDTVFLVDYGMEQGINIFENAPLSTPPENISFVLLTHAHIDHSGLLPVLYKNGFRGKIYATDATCDLCRIMLLDSANIQESDAAYKNKKALRAGEEPVEPLYTTEEAEKTLDQAVAANPRNPSAYYNLALLLLQKDAGNKSSARRYYETGRAMGGAADPRLEALLK